MSDYEQVRTLVCVSDEDYLTPLLETLANIGDFEVIGEAANCAEALSFSRGLAPDLLIVDDDLAQGRGRDVVIELARERSVPTMLMVGAEDSVGRASGLDATQVSTLPRSVVRRQDNTARAHVRTRLRLLAARCSRARRTRNSDSLEHALAHVRESVQYSRIEESVAGLVADPLDLIVLLGAAGSCRALNLVLPTLRRLPVPTLVGVVDPEVDSLVEAVEASQKIRVARFDEPADLRELDGLLVTVPHTQAVVLDGSIEIRPRDPSLDLLAGSLSSLGRSALIVVMSADQEDCVCGVATAQESGVKVAVMAPAEVKKIGAARCLIEQELAAAVLSGRHLAWVLEHAVPRRV